MVVKLRNEGKTRAEIAALVNRSVGSVKTILSKVQLVLPMEVRQSNAYNAKLAKNPHIMSDMRKTLNAEVVERRSASIKEAYKDPELCSLKSKQTSRWWFSLSDSDKATMHQFKRGEESVRVQHLLTQEGFEDMKTRMNAMVSSKGCMTGDYHGSHIETSWKCTRSDWFQVNSPTW